MGFPADRKVLPSIPPVLDLAEFFGDKPDAADKREEVLKLMNLACKEYGLFQVVNHGVDPKLLNKVLKNVEEFFSLPLEEKIKSEAKDGVLGYVHQSGVLGFRDRKQHFMCAMEDNPASERNVWPESADFRQDSVVLGKEMQKAAKFVMSLLSQSLSLGSDGFTKAFEETDDYFNMLYYPGVPDYEGPVLAKHQDGTIFTLVGQLNLVPGYQVLHEGEWHDVMPEKDALIVNIGDLLQATTNGRYKSAVHRVVANKEDRFSFVYSYLPSKDVVVSPLPQFTDTEPQKYRSFKLGEYLHLRFENKKLQNNLGKEITIEHYAI